MEKLNSTQVYESNELRKFMTSVVTDKLKVT